MSASGNDYEANRATMLPDDDLIIGVEGVVRVPVANAGSSSSGSDGATGTPAEVADASNASLSESDKSPRSSITSSVTEKRSHKARVRRRQLRRLRAQRDKAAARPTRHASYSRRVTTSFALIAAMTALVLASILGIVWESQFQSYTHDNVVRVANATATQIGREYAVTQQFDDQTLDAASSVSRVSPGMAVRVVNMAGTFVYDDAQQLASDNGVSASAAGPDAAGDNQVTVPITIGGVAGNETVGEVIVWSYGTGSLLTQYDAKFRTDSYWAIVVAAAIAIAIASIVGFVYARGLVGPIHRLSEAATRIKEGDLTARTGLVGDDEMSQLGQTFDAMATSIEKDRKLERQLTTDVAHELRTPLMAIQANVEGMLDGVLPADQRRLSTLNSETRRLSRLVSALLTLSHLESGTEPFEFEQLNLAQLIGGLVESQRALFDSTGMTLTYECDEKVLVEGDADKLRQATLNLISNAVRYTDDDGKVLVEVYNDNDTEAVIRVSDSGIGIAEKDLPRVFSRFWRADAARDRESGGLGVGLAMVREIVARHHGRVDVTSKLGKGTTFYLYIPYKQPGARRDARHRDRSSRTRQTRGAHDAKTVAEAQRKAERETQRRGDAANVRSNAAAQIAGAGRRDGAGTQIQGVSPASTRDAMREAIMRRNAQARAAAERQVAEKERAKRAERERRELERARAQERDRARRERAEREREQRAREQAQRDHEQVREAKPSKPSKSSKPKRRSSQRK